MLYFFFQFGTWLEFKMTIKNIIFHLFSYRQGDFEIPTLFAVFQVSPVFFSVSQKKQTHLAAFTFTDAVFAQERCPTNVQASF